jgi:hypothetical protein
MLCCPRHGAVYQRPAVVALTTAFTIIFLSGFGGGGGGRCGCRVFSENGIGAFSLPAASVAATAPAPLILSAEAAAALVVAAMLLAAAALVLRELGLFAGSYGIGDTLRRHGGVCAGGSGSSFGGSSSNDSDSSFIQSVFEAGL